MRRKMIVFLLVSLSVIPSGYSHQNFVDSLQTLLRGALHDTDRVKTLNSLAWKLIYTNPDTSIILTNEAISITEKNRWAKRKANCTGRLGSMYYVKGEYDSALKYYFAALKMNKEMVGSDGHKGYKPGIAMNLGNIGNVYNDQGDYPRALESYLEALRLDEELENQSGIARHNSNIGLIYYVQDDFQKALQHFFTALALHEKLGSKSGFSITLGNIANVHMLQKDYSKALEYYFKAIEIEEEIGDKHNAARNMGNVGIIHFMEEDYTKAMQYYSDALKIEKEVGNQYGEAVLLGRIGNVHISTGEFKLAEEYIQMGLQLSEEIHLMQSLVDQYINLSELYDTMNRPDLAFEAYKLHIIYRDSVFNEENTKAQTRTEMKYEYEKTQLIKDQQEQEASRKEQEARSRRDNLQYSVVLICLLVIGVLVAMLGRLSLPERVAEGLIFFAFLLFFEFLLVLADPYIENWSSGAPGIKLLFNAGIAALIFPAHAFFESKLKRRLVKK